MTARARKPIPKAVQLRVFARDGWLCHYCGAPVVFAPALRLMQIYVAKQMPGSAPAYWSKNWRRDQSPLLDRLGFALDHLIAHSTGGGADEQNLVTACNKCNIRKSNWPEAEYRMLHPKRQIRARHGEPTAWDGLSAMFLALAAANPMTLTAGERQWATALRALDAARAATGGE